MRVSSAAVLAALIATTWTADRAMAAPLAAGRASASAAASKAPPTAASAAAARRAQEVARTRQEQEKAKLERERDVALAKQAQQQRRLRDEQAVAAALKERQAERLAREQEVAIQQHDLAVARQQRELQADHAEEAVAKAKQEHLIAVAKEVHINEMRLERRLREASEALESQIWVQVPANLPQVQAIAEYRAPAPSPVARTVAAGRVAPAVVAVSTMPDADARRGDQLMSVGEVAEARRVYERAAAAGSADAALGLGRSYDPSLAAVSGAEPVDTDALVADIWYKRAARLANPAADADARAGVPQPGS